MLMTPLFNVISAEATLIVAVLLACISFFAINFNASLKAIASAVAFFFMHHTVALHLHHHLHHHHCGHEVVSLPSVFASKRPGSLQYPVFRGNVL